MDTRHDSRIPLPCIVPNVELSPMCSSKFRPGPPPESAQAISQLIHELFSRYFDGGDHRYIHAMLISCLSTSCNILPLESLCIESGKAVWVLYADIVCLNYDGNITDASLLALTAALNKCNSIWDATLPFVIR